MAGTSDAVSAEPRAGARSSLILLNATFRAIADIGSKIATAALYLFIARKAGATQFGIFVFALSFAGIAITLGQFGQEIVLTREVARDHRRLDAYYSGVLLSRALLSVPPLLLALTVASLAGMSGHTRLVILLMGFGFVGDFLLQVSFAVFQAYERAGMMPVVLITQRWVTTAAAITALYLGGGIVAVSALYCAGALAAAALAAWLMYRMVARPRLRFDVGGALRVTREAVPVGLGMVAFLLLARIDTTMLAIFTPPSVVGQYGAAYRLLETTAFVTWSVNTASLPTMARLSPTSAPSVGAVYQRALKLVLVITVPMAVGAAILAGPIIALLYGPQYHLAGFALVLLAPTIMLFPVSSLSSQLFYAQNIRRIVAVTYLVVFVENVVLNLILIPLYSLNGAAIGTTISEFLVAGTLLFRSKSLRGRLHVRRILAGVALGSSAVAIVTVVLHQYLALAIPLAIVIYLAVFLAHERLVFPEDFAVIRHFAARLTPLSTPPAAS
ncbi:MAG TPA: flippase [Solirubrobacteraceae bacterium]|nr:flippase [Solirubrobacteraceae bacterium]